MSLGEISGTIRMVNEASPTFEAISADAASMGESIRATSTGEQVSFNQVGVAATEMGANVRSASSRFNEMQTHAEATTVSLTKVAGGIRETALMGSQLTSLAQDFGVLDSSLASKSHGSAMVQVVSSCAQMYNFLTVMTTGQTAACGPRATETATAGAVAASGKH
jgi:methyl-accepting chemotaxis protein